MRLQDSLSALTGLSGVSETVPKPNQSQTGFETILVEVDRRQQSPINDSSSRSRDENRQQRVSNHGDESRANRSERREERESRRNADATAESQEAVASVPAEPAGPVEEVQIDENEAAAIIAAILQVPVEVVMEWLEQLDMTPQDLVEPKNVTKLLQVALDAETPAQLLTDSQFPEMFKAINEAMAELMQEAEVQVTLTAASDSVKTQVAQTTLPAETDGLQMIVEDGEVIIAEQTMANEFENEENASQNSSDNNRQATVQTAETTVTQPVVADILPVEAPDILPTQPQIAPTMINMANAQAKVEAAVQQAQTPANINPADVIDQIMDQVRVTSNGGNFSEMRLTLRPESLGDIVLRVMTQNGIVTAMFEAENQRVKETLEANFNQLRNALEEQGLQFAELSVSVRQEGNERMNQFEYARQAARRRMERLARVGEGEEVEAEPIIQRHNGVIDVTA